MSLKKGEHALGSGNNYDKYIIAKESSKTLRNILQVDSKFHLLCITKCRHLKIYLRDYSRK